MYVTEHTAQLYKSRKIFLILLIIYERKGSGAKWYKGKVSSCMRKSAKFLVIYEEVVCIRSLSNFLSKVRRVIRGCGVAKW
jgi:hypothetical protein